MPSYRLMPVGLHGLQAHRMPHQRMWGQSPAPWPPAMWHETRLSGCCSSQAQGGHLRARVEVLAGPERHMERPRCGRKECSKCSKRRPWLSQDAARHVHMLRRAHVEVVEDYNVQDDAAHRELARHHVVVVQTLELPLVLHTRAEYAWMHVCTYAARVRLRVRVRVRHARRRRRRRR